MRLGLDIGQQLNPSLIDEATLVVANHSGGKDSQAMLIRLLDIVPTQNLLVVHASLGKMEWPGALELAEAQAKAAGLAFIVARAQKTLLEMVKRRHATRPDVPSWPSATTRQCTSDLKRGPIAREVRRYAKANGYTTVINCLGLRAEESPPRRKRPPLKRVDSACTRSREWLEWLPIQHLTRLEVFKTIYEAGQEPHYAYALGNDRLSCVFCIMASPNDLSNGARHFPDLLTEYCELEDSTGYTMHQSRRPLAELVEEAAA